MKTIFISILQGIEARNILRTDIFRTLSDRPDIRIVLIVPSGFKLEYYKREFPESDRLKYEVLEEQPVGFWEGMFRKAKVHLLRTETMDIKRNLSLLSNGNKMSFYSDLFLNRFLARRSIANIFRFFDSRFISDPGLFSLFDKYSPDMVFLAHLFGDLEVSILREAKRRGIRSIGFINSWDKLTSRCILRIIPDRLIVPNEISKKEAEKYHFVPPQKIFIGGAPQFDIYKELTPIDKESFCKKNKIDPKKEIILFAPIGRSFSDIDSFILKNLLEIIKGGQLVKDCHVIVRFPPNDNADMGEYDKELVSIQKPGTRFSSERGVDWDMNKDDLQELVDTMANSSIVICPPSTLSIDAFVVGKPVINIKFDYPKNNAGGFYKDPNIFYEMTHYKNLLDDNSVSMVTNKDELMSYLNSYLNDKDIKKEERKLSVSRQTGGIVGRSGRMIADFIIKDLF